MNHMLGRVLVCSCALFASARADDWQARVVVGNDAFNGAVTRFDDNGFTNDLALAVRQVHDGVAIGGSFLDRMITSSASGLRCDMIELFGTAAWSPRAHLELSARLGPVFAGDLGGAWLQSHWHPLTGTGPPNPKDVPREYASGPRGGGIGGLTLSTSYGAPVTAYGSVDGQLAVGATGVSFVEGRAGLAASAPVGAVRLGIHAELALARYVAAAQLALPGAYRAGWQRDRRVGVHAGLGRHVLSFEYRTNESGSGEPFGVIALERR